MTWEEWDSNWYASAGNDFVVYEMPENVQSEYISQNKYMAKNLYADNNIDLYALAPESFTKKLENNNYDRTLNRYMRVCMDLFTKSFIVHLTEDVNATALDNFISRLYDCSSEAMRCLFGVTPDQEDLIAEINKSKRHKFGFYLDAIDIQKWSLQSENLEGFASKLEDRFLCVNFSYYQDEGKTPIEYERDIYEQILNPFDIDSVLIDGDQYNFNQRCDEIKRTLEC